MGKLIKYSMQRKHIFLAGANTASGFVSYFNNILEKNKKNYTFVLKGGPGTGKSTLMKKVSNYFYKKGFDIEEFFCSSDIKSLDAVKISQKNICVVDGTAPHEQDASLPKVSGEIVDLGECVDAKIFKYKQKIDRLISLKQKCFKNAYVYLSLAGNLLKSFNKQKQFSLPDNLNKRSFYFNYFCADGIKSFENKNKYKTYNLNSKNQQLFNKLISEQKNIVEIKSVLTDGVKAVVFSDVNIMFKVEKIVLDDENKQMFNKLCLLAGKNIEIAKAYHKEIEKIYLNYINFNKLNEIAKKLIKKIENK